MKEIFLIKVGNKDRPVSQEDIDEIYEAFDKASKQTSSVIITHHDICVERLLFTENSSRSIKVIKSSDSKS